MSHSRKNCEICGEEVAHGNLSRHMKRKHANVEVARPGPAASSTPIERYRSVGDVLSACGIQPSELGGWSIAGLNKLPNMRLYQPAPRRHHTPWALLSDEALNILPTLESLLLDVSHRVKSRGSMFAGTQVYRDQIDVTHDFNAEKWANWISRVLAGQEVSERVLNATLGQSIDSETTHAFRKGASVAMARLLPQLQEHGYKPAQANANITPRGTRTEVHHDSEPHISTAFGLANRANYPAKLWLLWPSTEQRHLGYCYDSTMPTNVALDRMDHGCFLVQMPGESVVVPPNSPHAVISLESCYLYGHCFTTKSWAHDPSTLYAEIRSTGIDESAACEHRLRNLKLGLASADFRQATADQFLETWSMEAPVFYRWPKHFHKLVHVWAQHISTQQLCAWCIGAGTSQSYAGGSESESDRHIRTHLGCVRCTECDDQQ